MRSARVPKTTRLRGVPGTRPRRSSHNGGLLIMAEGGCSCRRSRRHFADVENQDLTGRFGASNPPSRPSQVGQLQTSVNGGSEAVCGRNELAPSWDQTEESARTLLPSEWRPRPATLASKRFAFARSTSSCQLVTSNESVAMPTLARNWMSAWHTATLPASRPVAGALRDGRFARPR